MEFLSVIAYLLGGGLILSYGANLFVNSSSHLARKFRISPVIVGLTVVAFGTSAPELAVNIIAALKGNTDIAMGNVVGSNIFNIAFILGLCATISPLFVTAQLIRLDIPIMVFVSILLWWMSVDYIISFSEGLVLLLGIFSYTFLQIKMAIKGKNADEEYSKEYSDNKFSWFDGLKLIFGLGALVLGAHLFVSGAVIGAKLLGISEAVIGLTIIAAGTSLPEVATSVAATLKGERDIAVGNVVGSNVFNILGVIGFSSLLAPRSLEINGHIANVDIPIMFALSFVCLPFCIWRKQLDRLLGVVLFGSWIFYTYYLIQK